MIWKLWTKLTSATESYPQKNTSYAPGCCHVMEEDIINMSSWHT